jgi:hypothetical protein
VDTYAFITEEQVSYTQNQDVFVPIF